MSKVPDLREKVKIRHKSRELAGPSLSRPLVTPHSRMEKSKRPESSLLLCSEASSISRFRFSAPIAPSPVPLLSQFSLDPTDLFFS